MVRMIEAIVALPRISISIDNVESGSQDCHSENRGSKNLASEIHLQAVNHQQWYRQDCRIRKDVEPRGG